jgi:DNA methyltransferase 1-associated protein 1
MQPRLAARRGRGTLNLLCITRLPHPACGHQLIHLSLLIEWRLGGGIGLVKMGDVADILGLGSKGGGDGTSDPLSLALGDGRKGKNKDKDKRASKPAGMSREVYALLGKEGMPPVAPVSKPTIVKGMKARRDDKDTKWVWAPFGNSARSDGLQLRHWVKEGVEYPDYPYARYNVKLDAVSYTDEEYASYLEVSGWTKPDTDTLVAMCRRYNLCWPVIADRCATALSAARPVEQLQHRYYSIATRLRTAAAATAALASAVGGGDASVVALPGVDSFNLEYEQHRRQQLHVLFHKTRQSEQEEEALREELKLIEQQIKKLKQKKDTGSSSKGGDELSSLVEARRGIAAAPAIGQPYLQSMRLSSASQTPMQPLSKQLIKKMKLVMTELQVPERPTPTKAVCDLYDALQKDIITMLTLEKIARKKEAELMTLKLQQQSPSLHAQGLAQAGGAMGHPSQPGTASAGGEPKRRKIASSSGTGGPSNSKGKRIKR